MTLSDLEVIVELLNRHGSSPNLSVADPKAIDRYAKANGLTAGRGDPPTTDKETMKDNGN